MDEKGFIFTVDASLALIVVIVLTATITAYTLLPYYQGEDHQHLETLADSILETMEQSGQLRTDAVYYSSGDASLIAKANADLNTTLGMLVPSGIAYRITMTSGNSYVVQNTTGTRNLLTSNDIATKVKVISGPQEGWVGRAYYKIEQVQFEDQTDTAVTTLWNFHNWLQNFDPWDGGLDDYNYWGGNNPSYGSQVPKSISFYINGTSINGAKFLIGSAYDRSSWSNPSAFGAKFILNGIANHNITSANFGSALYYTAYSSGYTNYRRYMYNYLGNISKSELNIGTNNFYIDFSANSYQELPWFSIIGNYTTTMKVPQGVVTATSDFPDIAGAGTSSNSLTYDLNTGTVTNSSGSSISWNTIQSSDINTNKPFQITGIPYGTSTGSAVASVSNVYLPPNTRLFDAYTVINPYGGVDRAIVQVKNSKGTWQTIFTSFGSYTERDDGGYGNIPGILNIAPYLTSGNNQVRVIIWDDAPSSDNDLVGLTSCYSIIKYSQLPIRWDTYPFDSKQYDDSTATQTKTFKVDSDAQEAILFIGTGLDTKNITVTIKNSTGASSTLYSSGPVPFSLDLGDLDAAKTTHLLTTINPNGTYQLKPGNYTISLSITPGASYESGDYGGSSRPSGAISYNAIANPEIFSGTRVSIVYPKFLSSIWVDSFASNPTDAKTIAANNLTNTLRSYGYTVDTSQIKTEAIYTGDVPNSIPVRLELWKQ